MKEQQGSSENVSEVVMRKKTKDESKEQQGSIENVSEVVMRKKTKEADSQLKHLSQNFGHGEVDSLFYKVF